MAKKGIQSKREGPFSKGYAILFILLLAMPLLSLPFFFNSDRNSEKRIPVAFPSLSSDYGEFPSAFEEWFEDHFGFRSEMIRFYRQSRFELGLLSSMNNVVRGKEGWLYFSGGGNGDSIQEYAGANTFSEKELVRLQNYYETWEHWLEGQGVQFSVLVAPSKVSVYPEFLPNGLEKSPYGTRFERFLGRMSDSSVSIVFPLDELVEAKLDEPHLYYKLDTHWNAKGMFIAYDAFADKLSESKRILRSDIQFDGNIRKSGDLSKMLGVQSDWDDLAYSVILNKGTWPRDERVSDSTGKSVHRFVGDDSSLPRALVFHDSFLEPMKELLASHFSETNFIADKALQSDFVLEMKPDVVIVEFTERFLHTYLNRPLPNGEL